MKKMIILIITLCFTMIFIRAGDENEKKEVPSTDIFLWESTTPVPGNMKPGFDSISVKDAETYLGFLASDLLEGRDTGSNMYDIAAEFAAALFRLWEIKPAGNFPARRFVRAFASLKGNKKPLQKERTFFQQVIMKEVLDFDQSVTIQQRKGSISHSRTFYPDVDYMKSYFYILSGNTVEISSPVVFAGYGISEKSLDFDEYKGIDARGKVVLVFSGIPGEDKEDSPFKKGKLREKYYPTQEQLLKQGFMSPKTQLAMEKGAAAVLMVDPSTPTAGFVERIKKYKQKKKVLLSGIKYINLFPGTSDIPGEEIPTIRISNEMADIILGFPVDSRDLENLKNDISSKLKSQSRELPGTFITIKQESKTQLVESRNVLGFIEGSHPELKKEVVVIGAHLDHLGKRENYIYNGADDNGSGSAAVLELAQAFALNPVKPKRSILFALWTGEERNLIGANYYVNAPYFPLEKTTAYLNIDMIGWVWENKEIMAKFLENFEERSIPGDILKKIDVSKFLTPLLAEDAPGVYEAIKDMSQCVEMSLLLIKKDGKMIGGDYTSFARKNIPWVHFATGYCEKYHKPEDDIEYIDFDILQRVSRLIYLTAFMLADK